jgi:hypothetical protein
MSYSVLPEPKSKNLKRIWKSNGMKWNGMEWSQLFHLRWIKSWFAILKRIVFWTWQRRCWETDGYWPFQEFFGARIWISNWILIVIPTIEKTITMRMRQTFAPGEDRNHILCFTGTHLSIRPRSLPNSCKIIHLSKRSLVSQSYTFDCSCLWFSFRIRFNLSCRLYHNFLSHTSESEGNGIKSELLDCDSDILTMHDCSRGNNDALGEKVVSPNQMGFPQSCINVQCCEEHDELLTEFVCDIWMWWWCFLYWINIAFGWIKDLEKQLVVEEKSRRVSSLRHSPWKNETNRRSST